MKSKQVLFNNRGQTLAEALVGLALLSIVFAIFTRAHESLNKMVTSTYTSSETDRLVNEVAENIRTGFENYQINFGSDDQVQQSLNVNSLPMAWGVGTITTASKCADCPGRYGYVIQPISSSPGLFQVTLRLTHKSWIEKGEQSRDYVFVVSAK